MPGGLHHDCECLSDTGQNSTCCSVGMVGETCPSSTSVVRVEVRQRERIVVFQGLYMCVGVYPSG